MSFNLSDVIHPDPENAAIQSINVNQQSHPTAALGGADQDKRNWRSGIFTLAGGDSRDFDLDAAMGDYVTVIRWLATSRSSLVTEDGIAVAMTPCQMNRFRRNGTRVTVANTDGANAAFFIVHVTDLESAPFYG